MARRIVTTLPAGVSRTALGVARLRAAEARRPDPLFHDPYAVAFVAAAPDVLPPRPAPGSPEAAVGAALAVHVSLRTRFFDDYLLDACAGGIRQVVLLAAGLDTRSYRLDWQPGVRVFEIDVPEVLAFKDRVLTDEHALPTCTRVAVAADLRGDWVESLRDAGFADSVPTAWLVEGLLVYLSADEAAHVLRTLTTCSAPGSTLAMEDGRAAADLRSRAESVGAPGVTALWQGGLGTGIVDWLTAAGWSVVVHDRDEVAQRYGRTPPGTYGSGFITAVR